MYFEPVVVTVISLSLFTTATIFILRFPLPPPKTMPSPGANGFSSVSASSINPALEMQNALFGVSFSLKPYKPMKNLPYPPRISEVNSHSNCCHPPVYAGTPLALKSLVFPLLSVINIPKLISHEDLSKFVFIKAKTLYFRLGFIANLLELCATFDVLSPDVIIL